MPFKIFVVIPVELPLPGEHPTMDEAREELERQRIRCPDDHYLIKEIKPGPNKEKITARLRRLDKKYSNP